VFLFISTEEWDSFNLLVYARAHEKLNNNDFVTHQISIKYKIEIGIFGQVNV